MHRKQNFVITLRAGRMQNAEYEYKNDYKFKIIFALKFNGFFFKAVIYKFI